MRITNSMMTNNYLFNLSGNLNRLSKYLEQESTGKVINRISDDPVKTTLSLSARNKLSSVKRYMENVNTAKNWLTEVEESVGGLNEIIQDAYEKAVSASSGTMNESDLSAIAQEIAALRDEVLSTANATFGDSYIFAGFNTTGTSSGKLPFTVDSNGDLFYNGINMSNETSVDIIAGAFTDAQKAYADAAAADAIVQGAASSEYNKIIESAGKVIETVKRIGSAGKATIGACLDLAASSDIDATTAADLTTAVATLQTDSDNLNAAFSDAEEALSVAQAAADAAAAAYSRLQDALASGDSGAIINAQNDYDDASAAAATAAADLQAASNTALSAAENLKDMINDGDPFTLSDVQSVIDNSTALPAASAALDAQSGDVLSVQVGSGQTMQVSVAGTDLLGRGGENLYAILNNFYNDLISGAEPKALSKYITQLQDSQSRILSTEAKVGAELDRLNTLSARYEANIINYTAMKSDAEDADLAEVITNFTTAETVYNAALAAGAEIIQTSLIDFLR